MRQGELDRFAHYRWPAVWLAAPWTRSPLQDHVSGLGAEDGA
ncbi:hypothetical protein [Streptomyces sp. NBC_00035]